MTDRLTHLDERGQARMVDVAAKEVSVRTATASGVVRTAAAGLIRAGEVAKGDVEATARLAGIMATKRTADLVPLCHPIAIHGVSVEVETDPVEDVVRVMATVRTADRTGVEMEALTAVCVACLTIIDMTKAVDPAGVIEDVKVLSKTGGAKGDWRR